MADKSTSKFQQRIDAQQELRLKNLKEPKEIPAKKTTSSKKKATKKKPKKTGRQLEYERRHKKSLEVLKLVTDGMSLRKALIINKMSSETFYKWVDEFTPEEIKNEVKTPIDNASQYARACDERQEALLDEMYEIADNGKFDKKIIHNKSGKPIEITDKEVTERSKMQLDLRKWHLSKLNPTRFGDKVEVSGKQDITIDFT